MDPKIEYMTTSQAAQAWGISRQRLHQVIKAGRFPAEHLVRLGDRYGVTAAGMTEAFGPRCQIPPQS